MNCECDGTGFVFFKADYTSPMGHRAKNVSQARRCPGYIEYFRSSPLMQDHPGKAPVLGGTQCKAAVEIHKKLQIRDDKDDKKGTKKA